ncbi:hypothetical protein PENTCL1PPCAC_1252 [Pristionchus entomophagus]|uniref:Trehalase n=1 Tax=Pristionchus entomophagus TaxID=358040 RepID=A0AAV5S7X3_9BILA|nr:hypothetical protein PENTCL1PPCAC_1252 [Pristionchus entomophagus]
MRLLQIYTLSAAFLITYAEDLVVDAFVPLGPLHGLPSTHLLPSSLLFQQPANVNTDEGDPRRPTSPGGGGTEPTVNVCDETNADNWFIYCSGPLLEAVNVHSLFNDSKTFVDMPLKEDPKYVNDLFHEQFNVTVDKINRDELLDFVNEYFSPPGSELAPCVPIDWHPQPQKIMGIQDPDLREWALSLHGIWKTLCKKIHEDIEDHKERYSLIWLEHEFIAPGGRFREFYYWDAYWIVKGLIASEMYTTVQKMIENLASMIDRYGFVPNGGRIYYLKRSQPPMFSAMVYEYYESTHDKAFVRKMLPYMEMEQDFWNDKRMIDVRVNTGNFTVYQYRTEANVPRPESYREDILSAQNINKNDRQRFWRDIASAAESGWDFSTRWFKESGILLDIETTTVLPVDLNAFQCWNMDILEYLYERTGNKTQSEYYRNKRADFRDTIHHVFYNNTAGSWFDYNLRTKGHNLEFYASIAVPLFTGCYHSLNQAKSESLFKLMNESGVFNYPGGVPTSMNANSSEQWDFPNGFSNLNHMIIEGLRKSENAQMQDKAFKIAEKWVFGNYKVFAETGHMWEKYNVIGNVPKPGSGGEYDVQDGFGWTNGVILDLLITYNHRLKLPDQLRPTATPAADTDATDRSDSSSSDPSDEPAPSRSTRSVADDPSTTSAAGTVVSLCSLVLLLLSF